MEQYFYLDVNKVQQGPVDGSQLVKFGVTPTTLVWKQGMAQWTPAGQVPELAAIFNVLEEVQQPQQAPQFGPQVAQPNFYNQQAYNQAPQMPPPPDNYLVWAILATICCCLPFGIVSIVYATKVNGLYQMGQYQEALAASNSAKTWAIASAICGVIIGIIYFFIGLAQGLMLR